MAVNEAALVAMPKATIVRSATAEVSDASEASSASATVKYWAIARSSRPPTAWSLSIATPLAWLSCWALAIPRFSASSDSENWLASSPMAM